MNNIYMFRPSKIVMFKLNIIGYFFFLLYVHAWYAQKEIYIYIYIYKENQKQKESK